ncbi:helix-turn-helix domain-containing protein [Nonomuraea fuscirosea]|uniref:helix-turn-helix domain-containing protein n=1 Tax=Nonomuraea fuscirosea TaxID=1291556 RepID=UPI0033C6ACC9
MTHPGDFGRRITHHRTKLNLTLEEVADRADMSAGCVQRLEDHLGAPDRGTVTRLAKALETTEEALLGGGYERYQVHDGAIVFRTAHGGPMGQDLRTGVEGVEIEIGFQVDRIDEARREGWSVLVQGPAHHVPDDEAATVSGADVTPWAGGDRHLYIRIAPHQITGRRIHGL